LNLNRHGAPSQAYQNKRNGVSAWELFSKNARDTRRKEFLKMRGPRGVGQAEMAVSIVAEDRSDDGAQGGGVRGYGALLQMLL
jgi:hypothetical protein